MVSALMFLMMLTAGNIPEMMVPEGTVLPVVLNEKISTKTVQENDPILFSLADDIRVGGHRGAVLIPRGSNVVGRVIRTDRAGHFIGRATIDIRMEKIVTPNGDVYDGLSTKVVDLSNNKGRKGQVKSDGEIEGPVHRKRDAFFLLFPPTTIFQLIAIPARGPDVLLPAETRLYVKLMNPIYVERQIAEQVPAMPMQAPQMQLPPMRVPQSMAAPIPQSPVPAAQSMPVPVPQPMIPQTVITQPIMVQPVMPQAVRYQSWADLDRLLSPVALYPDPLLSAVLIVCSHPEQMNQLAAYPALVSRMSADPFWMSSLGNAYLVQPNDVMNSVQRLRRQALVVRGVAPAMAVAPAAIPAPVYVRPY